MTADDPSKRAGQREHWSEIFAANPDMYGREPSEAAMATVEEFRAAGVRRVLELGAGQGRDTLCFAARGFDVVAVDYAAETLETITTKAAGGGMAERVAVLRHDIHDRLPFNDRSFDACYSHMLFCMALTTTELEQLVIDVARVVRPGGLVVYTVRHIGDAHYATGRPHGDDMFENGGFIVHFFNRDLVERLAARDFEIIEVDDFIEGDLPRRLWRVAMRKRSG